MSRAQGEHPSVNSIGPVEPNKGDQKLEMW